jgi:hypothetical protein
MPPEERFVCRFPAEPPQDPLPYGRWAERLGEVFAEALAEHDVEPGELAFHPDRTWEAVTYVPVTAPVEGGDEVFGFVDFSRADEDTPEPHDFDAAADVAPAGGTGGALDLNQEVIGHWRGEQGNVAEMTLVWGRALAAGGAAVTAELAGLVVDQCVLQDGRFTLIAPDAYRGDELEIVLWSAAGKELGRESIYEDDDEDAADDDGDAAGEDGSR